MLPDEITGALPVLPSRTHSGGILPVPLNTVVVQAEKVQGREKSI